MGNRNRHEVSICSCIPVLKDQVPIEQTYMSNAGTAYAVFLIRKIILHAGFADIVYDNEGTVDVRLPEGAGAKLRIGIAFCL